MQICHIEVRLVLPWMFRLLLALSRHCTRRVHGYRPAVEVLAGDEGDGVVASPEGKWRFERSKDVEGELDGKRIELRETSL